MVSRTDTTGAARAGSQLQTQLWVNRRTTALDQALRTQLPELGSAAFHWKSPLAETSYSEHQDARFLEAVELADHAAALKRFWPSRGPVWDALATVEVNGAVGVLLGEGKSYPGELYGGGCKAGPKSLAGIRASLAQTQQALGVRTDVDVWCGPLYQTANRLAHLHWLRDVIGVQAWFVHLLFVDDPHTPTSVATWERTLAAADKLLGLPESVPGAGHVFLEHGTDDELVGPSPA
jgi:hypothetical protein